MSRIDCGREIGPQEDGWESILMVQERSSHSLDLGGISGGSEKCEQSGDN